jgi:NAD(P)-dependent dehydrogenase (short-subunit alcohol dehydrogenase family)
MFDLSDKVIVVTGGNGGLGLAMSKGLLKMGAKVAIWARNEEKNKAAARDINSVFLKTYVCDVSSETEVLDTLEKTIKDFGKVDVCFANAGGAGVGGLFHKTSTEDWTKSIDLNLGTVVNTFKPIIAYFVRHKIAGKLIVTSSIAANLGVAYAAAYSTLKAAVLGLVRALAIELGPKNIQVNAILPGYIATEMSVETPQVFKDAVNRRFASGKLGTLEDMEGIAVFMASKHSDFMTGQAIVLDGGHSINPF